MEVRILGRQIWRKFLSRPGLTVDRRARRKFFAHLILPPSESSSNSFRSRGISSLCSQLSIQYQDFDNHPTFLRNIFIANKSKNFIRNTAEYWQWMTLRCLLLVEYSFLDRWGTQQGLVTPSVVIVPKPPPATTDRSLPQSSCSEEECCALLSPTLQPSGVSLWKEHF